jgi:hypothetical protein
LGRGPSGDFAFVEIKFFHYAREFVGAENMAKKPLLKAELANRAFAVRTLARLGLDLDPVKPVGRPPGKGFPGIGWDSPFMPRRDK